MEIVQSLRDNAFDHMQKLPLAYLDRNQPGDMISRISTDVDQFADGLLMGFYTAVHWDYDDRRDFWLYALDQC